MPNKPSPHKCVLSIRVQRTLKRRLHNAARTRKMSITEYVEWILWRETQDVPLTSDDYTIIANETAKATRDRS